MIFYVSVCTGLNLALRNMLYFISLLRVSWSCTIPPSLLSCPRASESCITQPYLGVCVRLTLALHIHLFCLSVCVYRNLLFTIYLVLLSDYIWVLCHATFWSILLFVRTPEPFIHNLLSYLAVCVYLNLASHNLLVYLAVCTYTRTFYSQPAILSCCCVYLNLASHNLLVYLAVSVNTNLICVTEPSGLSCCLCEYEPNLRHRTFWFILLSLWIRT